MRHTILRLSSMSLLDTTSSATGKLEGCPPERNCGLSTKRKREKPKLEDYYKQEDFSEYDWEFLEDMLDDIIPYVYYDYIPSWFHCLAHRFKRQPLQPF